MAKVSCVNCGKELGIRKMKTKAGPLCVDCYKVCNSSFNSLYLIQDATLEDIQSCFSSDGKIATTTNGMLAFSPQTWHPTKVVACYFEVDEENKLWLIPDGMFGGKKSPIIYSFDKISEFELLEDGNSITKGGLGRALVGGALFGGVGAIVGGVTGGKKTKQLVNKLQIKITTNDMSNPAIYINLISGPTKTQSMIYKSSYNAAQEILSILTVITKSQEPRNSNIDTSAPQTSTADEIRKFKQLLDDGIITEEEFSQKKKDLLGM